MNIAPGIVLLGAFCFLAIYGCGRSQPKMPVAEIAKHVEEFRSSAAEILELCEKTGLSSILVSETEMGKVGALNEAFGITPSAEKLKAASDNHFQCIKTASELVQSYSELFEQRSGCRAFANQFSQFEIIWYQNVLSISTKPKDSYADFGSRSRVFRHTVDRAIGQLSPGACR